MEATDKIFIKQRKNIFLLRKRTAPLDDATYQLYVQFFGVEVANQQNDTFQAGDASDAWYSEEANYDYVTGSSSNGGVIGHFTQLVWISTTQVGFGMVSKPVNSDYSETVVVAFYSPPGNFVMIQPGQTYEQARLIAYTTNVLAPS